MAESNVAASVTDVTILAANSLRQNAAVFNNSTATLYLLCANATSSASVFTAIMPGGSYYEVPYRYTGILKGIWTAADGGFARVTENT